jgi:hypothetical protein
MAEFTLKADRWGDGELRSIQIKAEGEKILLTDEFEGLKDAGVKMMHNGLQLRFTLPNGVCYITFNDEHGQKFYCPPKPIAEMCKDLGGK